MVIEGVILKDELDAGTIGTKTLEFTGARSTLASVVTAGINPTSSRDTTSSDAYKSGIKFVNVLVVIFYSLFRRVYRRML